MDASGGAGVNTASPTGDNPAKLEEFTYDDAAPRAFAFATIVWGMVGMLVGLIAAAELAVPKMGAGHAFLAFGRLRPLHTNAVVFAFAGNAIFAAIYYSTQRLCKARMFSAARCTWWARYWPS
jgi:cytochrome c oxidase cbb3-type subunit I/II